MLRLRIDDKLAAILGQWPSKLQIYRIHYSQNISEYFYVVSYV